MTEYSKRSPTDPGESLWAKVCCNENSTTPPWNIGNIGNIGIILGYKHHDQFSNPQFQRVGWGVPWLWNLTLNTFSTAIVGWFLTSEWHKYWFHWAILKHILHDWHLQPQRRRWAKSHSDLAKCGNLWTAPGRSQGSIVSYFKLLFLRLITVDYWLLLRKSGIQIHCFTHFVRIICLSNLENHNRNLQPVKYQPVFARRKKKQIKNQQSKVLLSCSWIDFLW